MPSLPNCFYDTTTCVRYSGGPPPSVISRRSATARRVVLARHVQFYAMTGPCLISWPVAPSPPTVVPAPGGSRVDLPEARGLGDTEPALDRDEFDRVLDSRSSCISTVISARCISPSAIFASLAACFASLAACFALLTASSAFMSFIIYIICAIRASCAISALLTVSTSPTRLSI